MYKENISYSFSSERSLAFALVTLMFNCWARSTINFLFLLDTQCAMEAAKVLFCMSSTSSSCKQTDHIQEIQLSLSVT